MARHSAEAGLQEVDRGVAGPHSGCDRDSQRRKEDLEGVAM